MLDRKQRVLKEDLTDVSASVNSILDGSTNLDSDTFYIGAELPFNHKYFQIVTANASAKVLSGVDLWDGARWVATVDVQDETAASGISLAQSGAISWQMDPDLTGWSNVSDTARETGTGLETLRIIGLYWARFRFSTATGSGTCSYIGERFCDETALLSLYPDLRSAALKRAFSASKTTWNDECLIASEAVVSHLRRIGLIFRREQMMDTSIYREAAIHKAASIIFNGLGNGYTERMKIANDHFKISIAVRYPEIDRNGSGKVSSKEKNFSTSFTTR